MSLMRIRLELAQSPDFPAGSTSHGYEFVAPMKSDGHIHALECHAVRFWGDAPEEKGLLHRERHGWRFDNKKSDEADNEACSRQTHPLTPGGLISIVGRDGKQRPFRVLMMVPWG